MHRKVTETLTRLEGHCLATIILAFTPEIGILADEAVFTGTAARGRSFTLLVSGGSGQDPPLLLLHIE